MFCFYFFFTYLYDRLADNAVYLKVLSRSFTYHHLRFIRMTGISMMPCFKLTVHLVFMCIEYFMHFWITNFKLVRFNIYEDLDGGALVGGPKNH